MILRRRFADLIGRQLDLFEADNAELLADCAAAERAYDEAPRDEAEERYADYLDLVETGTDELVELRDNYSSTLDEDAAEEYQEVFNRVVRKRLPRFGLQLD